MPTETAEAAAITNTKKNEGEEVTNGNGAPRNKDARLHWENVTLTVEAERANDKITILDGVWGEVPQGQISAIMGPSGSGKSSLLNVLSGRMTNDTQNVEVDATTVSWNGRPLDVQKLETRQSIAFVAQDDSLPVTATPREAILFSARLRLNKNKTLDELQEITNHMLEQLHLESCADTFVGGALIKGISGGERKRTSVGVELVCKPKLIFLDEPVSRIVLKKKIFQQRKLYICQCIIFHNLTYDPYLSICKILSIIISFELKKTSGLDSFNALELVQVLREVASAGSAVMLTIHQPSSDIWDKFDRITILKDGRVMFEGRRETLGPKFASCGYPLPQNYNPADWVMEVAQRHKNDALEEAGFFPVNEFSEHGKKAEMKTDTSHMSDASNALAATAKADDRVGFLTQIKWLFCRELSSFKRNTHPLKARMMMTIVISLLCGLLFWQVAEDSMNLFVNVQTLFGALILALMANMFSTTLPALIAFPEERPVFLREYSTGQYTVLSYFLSRVTLELAVCAFQVTVSTMITYLMVGLNQTFGLYWLVTYIMAVTSTALGAMAGSSASDPSVAVEFLPAIFMPQILFSGFFIPKEIMPVWLSWLTYIFPMTYAVRLVLVQEFDGACDDMSGNSFCERMISMSGADLDAETCQSAFSSFGVGEGDLDIPDNCEVLLENVEANSEDTWWYWIVLSAQFVFFRILALIILRKKAQQFY